jgi:hypothetical protein
MPEYGELTAALKAIAADIPKAWAPDPAPEEMLMVAGNVERAAEVIEGLAAAIARHRDQRGDDRCWRDDLELYAALPGPPTPANLALPPREEFLASCERFWRQRQPGGACTAGKTIAQLEAEVDRLRAERGALADALRGVLESACHVGYWSAIVFSHGECGCRDCVRATEALEAVRGARKALNAVEAAGLPVAEPAVPDAAPATDRP